MRMNIRRPVCLAGITAVLLALCVGSAMAGGGFGLRQNSVGGVIVDAGGVVRSATPAERQAFLAEVRARVVGANGQLAEQADLRMISLKRLQAAIVAALDADKPLPEDVRYLAGLVRIDYVFVDPGHADIVIAGPAEPWAVQPNGAVVGAVSGQPMMFIDDLVTAMQSVEKARNRGISCSIEPTAEGVQALNRLLSRVRLTPGQNPKLLEPQMKQAFGPQTIKLTGVPAESHYARIMVAADYQMKRIAMGLESSSIAGLPSYIELARGAITQDNSNPRWWMSCDEASLLRSDDRLSWQLAGRRVKTLTETDLIGADGQVAGRAKADTKAQQWADLMTEHFGDLVVRYPVFGQLRNVIDLSIVATLIVQERLDDKAGVNLDVLLGRGADVPVAVFTAPTVVSPECSFLRGPRGWIVTASGGVEVNAFEVVSRQQSSAALTPIRSKSIPSDAADGRWWWNG